jgi:hypothetical protein
MTEQKTLVKILNTINSFNESIAKNLDNIEFPLYELKYCVSQDTFHSFKREKCINCCSITPGIKISAHNFEEFRNYLKEGWELYPELIRIVDNWQSKNNFPHIHPAIVFLSEHERLEELFDTWLHMNIEEKFEEVYAIHELQKKFYNKLDGLEDLRKSLF